jgi:hypothetical protein
LRLRLIESEVTQTSECASICEGFLFLFDNSAASQMFEVHDVTMSDVVDFVKLE